MLRILAIALVPIVLVATPAAAVTDQEKMETCKVGAQSQQLQGTKRDAFIKKCMAGGNYEPAARKNTAKQPGPKPQ
jgi:hypothetical protein